MKKLGLKPMSCLVALLSNAFLAFGMYNVHEVADVTEGGVLGATLLLEQWFQLSPSVSGVLLNLICYAAGWKLMGRSFLGYSLVATAGFSAAYYLCEQFPPLWPGIADHPLVAAVVGALFVGIGCGLTVRVGGAGGGDDALAMCVSRVTGCPIQWVYLISDLSVLLLSLSYIPLRRIAYSILTVLISGQVIGLLQREFRPRVKEGRGEAA